jgi:hypothetical protein
MTETWHGRPSGYSVRNCRCRQCTAANTDQQKSYRSRKYEARVLISGRLVHLQAPHGTQGGYTNYGCRCVHCTRAAKRAAA